MTGPEQILWYWLRNKNLNGYKFRRQHSVGYYILDFYCPEVKLAIELDGDSHFNPQGKAYDKERDIYLSAHGIVVMRFTNDEVTNNLNAVIEKIVEFLP